MLNLFFVLFFVVVLVRCLESGLQYRYQASWGIILEVLGVLFEVRYIQCFCRRDDRLSFFQLLALLKQVQLLMSLPR